MRGRGHGDTFDAFVPKPLPPQPPLVIDAALLQRAERAVLRLDGVSALLPDTSLFVYSWVRKEALLSAQIEGALSSFSDLLLFETRQAPGESIGGSKAQARLRAYGCQAKKNQM